MEKTHEKDKLALVEKSKLCTSCLLPGHIYKNLTIKPTASLTVYDSLGHGLPCRALLDCCYDDSFIQESL
ncbi:unnamed protein product, partial [Allacma fusca]